MGPGKGPAIDRSSWPATPHGTQRCAICFPLASSSGGVDSAGNEQAGFVEGNDPVSVPVNRHYSSPAE